MENNNFISVKVSGPDIPASEELSKYLATRCVTDGGLGYLDQCLVQLAGIQGRVYPKTSPWAALVFAADHGVVADGISNFTFRDTSEMVKGIVQGKTAVGVLARSLGISLACWDIGLKSDIESVKGQIYPLVQAKIARGTKNIALGPALTTSQCLLAIDAGRRAVSGLAPEVALLALGEMGMGNTTSAAALAAALLGEIPERVVGKGAGNQNVKHKVNVVAKALAVNQRHLNSPLEILASLGGLEIAALVGACLEGAARRIGIVLDGFVSTTAAMVATRLNPLVKYYLMPSHQAPEPGQTLILEELGLQAPLNLGLRIGEGAGALLLCPLLDQALVLLNGLAGFAELGIDKK